MKTVDKAILEKLAERLRNRASSAGCDGTHDSDLRASIFEAIADELQELAEELFEGV